MNTLYTIGYSSYDISHFISILKKQQIKALVDVRSIPYSKFAPDYNTDNIKKILENNSIYYLNFGDGLGARTKIEECYQNNIAQYSLISKTPMFKEYTKRIISGLEKFNIVLLCAESDPLKCHRDIMICRYLKKYINNISHILQNEIIEDNTQPEIRLLREYNLEQEDFFSNYIDRLNEAYDLRSNEIQYRRITQYERDSDE